jgi:hypothetical protein
MNLREGKEKKGRSRRVTNMQIHMDPLTQRELRKCWTAVTLGKEFHWRRTGGGREEKSNLRPSGGGRRERERVEFGEVLGNE